MINCDANDIKDESPKYKSQDSKLVDKNNELSPTCANVAIFQTDPLLSLRICIRILRHHDIATFHHHDNDDDDGDLPERDGEHEKALLEAVQQKIPGSRVIGWSMIISIIHMNQ